MPESISQFYKRIQLRPSQPDATYSKEKSYFNIFSRQCNFGTVQFSYRVFYSGGNWVLKKSSPNYTPWNRRIRCIFPIGYKRKTPELALNSGFTLFFLFNKWCHQQENYYLLSVDYHRFIVSSIWKSTRFSTRLCFVVLLAIRTILFSNISLFQYRLEFS